MVLDEITHLHAWFYPGEDCSNDAGYRHKVHRINGVYCFTINDREDQEKFGNWDGGMVLDSRASLLQKALYGNSSEIVVVFDDWEALAGKSFDPVNGTMIPNNNPNQYHATIRWAANHPWIQVATLKDLLARAIADPAAFVIDHGTRYDLPLRTYEYLMHSSEDSYDSWVYGNNGGTAEPEQDFYHLVPVISGAQGDYHARGATPASDGPGLPSGRTNGDMNTPGTLIHDTWATLQAAPAGRLRDLGIASFLAMIYETAWHEEDNPNYSNNCYGAWQYPDLSWDGVNTWALRLSNHVRGAGLYAAAARWADSVRTGSIAPHASPVAYSADLDADGEDEYVLSNARVFSVFERYGGRCVLACGWSEGRNDAEVVVGAPLTNPSSPGEEELASALANRCSAFKVMNGGSRADEPTTVTRAYGAMIPESYGVSLGWAFTSPDGQLTREVLLASGDVMLSESLTGSLPGTVYVRTGLSPNPLDLMRYGQAHLAGNFPDATHYRLVNSSGGYASLQWPASVTFNTSLANESADRRNLALTEEVELSGALPFWIALTVGGDTSAPPPAGVRLPVPGTPAAFAVSTPGPSPARGAARFTIALPVRLPVRWQLVDVAGRVVAVADLGVREPGTITVALDARATPAPGLYFVRVTAGGQTLTRRWAALN
jgi:hypothetical protein